MNHTKYLKDGGVLAKICSKCNKVFYYKDTNFCNMCAKRLSRAGNSAKDYQSFRHKVLYRDKRTCRDCGRLKSFIVHHIKSVTLYPELELVVDNGITLCMFCHRLRHPELPETFFTNQANYKHF